VQCDVLVAHVHGTRGSRAFEEMSLNGKISRDFGITSARLAVFQ
jgi:hypothetical protein